jgi:uncharacterized protein YecT (DUF1311 family)
MATTSKARGDAKKRLRWREKPRKVAIVGLAFLSAELCAAADREMTQEYSTCMDRSKGITVEMTNCILAETVRQDARLNENYRRLISKLSEERKKALLEAQRAWIQFRDANCSFYNDPKGGTAAHLAANECILNAIADRAKELQLLTRD